MIVVIADDISGAAELAGIAHARGLRARIQTRFEADAGTDVIALDTDTRAVPLADAVITVSRVIREVLRAEPEWIYKKTDSVLRGHVRAEISAMLDLTGQRRALFIPANPARGRVMRGGQYFVHDIPLHKTVFQADPEYPATSARVLDLLGREPGKEIRMLSQSDPLPLAGIAVPEITCTADLVHYTRSADGTCLCAGASEFFDSLLDARGIGAACPAPASRDCSSAPVTLFVCGSAVAWPLRRRECAARSIPVHPMPPDVFNDAVGEQVRNLAMSIWTASVGEALARDGCALIAIGDSPVSSRQSPGKLARMLSQAVKQVIDSQDIERLHLEGGATAAAVLRALNWTNLCARQTLGTSVAVFQVSGRERPLVSIKPGSYDWPESVWPPAGRA